MTYGEAMAMATVVTLRRACVPGCVAAKKGERKWRHRAHPHLCVQLKALDAAIPEYRFR